MPGLRHKAGGGQDGGHRADPVDEVHGVRVRCWGAGLISAGLPFCRLDVEIRCRVTRRLMAVIALVNPDCCAANYQLLGEMRPINCLLLGSKTMPSPSLRNIRGNRGPIILWVKV